MKDEEKLAFLLGREQSWQERILYMQQIGKCYKNYDIRVYGNDLWQDYIKQYHGYAGHFDIMPKVMRLSKINLNITRTFVEKGLPMRVFDVLGSGGFLITNYKEGLNYNFNLNKDFVVYRDLQDLLEIMDFYLQNEDKRLQIVHNGYETVRRYHTYEVRIKEIMGRVLNNRIIIKAKLEDGKALQKKDDRMDVE